MTITAIAEAIATHSGLFYHIPAEQLDVLAYLMNDIDRPKLVSSLNDCNADLSRKNELSSILADSNVLPGIGHPWSYRPKNFDLVMRLIQLYVDGTGHLDKMLNLEYENFGLVKTLPDGSGRESLWPERNLFSIVSAPFGETCSVRHRVDYGSRGDYFKARPAADDPTRAEFIRQIRYKLIRSLVAIIVAHERGENANPQKDAPACVCPYEWIVNGCITETGRERFDPKARQEIEESVLLWRGKSPEAL